LKKKRTKKNSPSPSHDRFPSTKRGFLLIDASLDTHQTRNTTHARPYPTTSSKNFPPVCKDFSGFTPVNALNIDENPLASEDGKALTAYPKEQIHIQRDRHFVTAQNHTPIASASVHGKFAKEKFY